MLNSYFYAANHSFRRLKLTEIERKVAGPLDVEIEVLFCGMRSRACSLIASIAETQEVMEFCTEHRIAPDIQVIPISEVNAAYKRVEDGEARFRYVIDMASLQAEIAAA